MTGLLAFALAAALHAGASPALRLVQLQRRAPSRELWQIDQLQLPLDTPDAVLKAMVPDHSMAAVIRRLQSLGIAFRRVRLTVTPDRLNPALREFVLKVPAGEPFVNREQGYISVNVLVGRRLPGDVARLAPFPLAQEA